MKKTLSVIITAVLILGLVGCSAKAKNNKSPSSQSSQEPSTNTNPEHSEFYLADYTKEQILTYFEEAVLNMEYSTGDGDVTKVQKWLTPIYYKLYGSYTKQDMIKLNRLFAFLNQMDGFPGIYPATDAGSENLSICFSNKREFDIQFSDFIGGEDAYGATEFFYYTDTNEIHSARIGYRTDIDQTTRDSILLEEIVNMLGISDTALREDSIVYQDSNENLVLSDVDILILKLLYNEKIECGMDYAACEKVIKELYY